MENQQTDEVIRKQLGALWREAFDSEHVGSFVYDLAHLLGHSVAHAAEPDKILGLVLREVVESYSACLEMFEREANDETVN